MAGIEDLSPERAEVAAVLASETFAKSPNLARLLEYVCRKSLQGESAGLKEYNIAVEGLGRSPDFDPATNSIVRVEVRRLRERLKKYYSKEGAAHELVILLEVGSYVPHFVKRPLADASTNGAAAGNPADADRIGRAAALRRVVPFVRNHATSLAASGAVLVVVLLVLIASVVGTSPNEVPSTADAASPVLTPADEVRLLAGYTKDKYVDRMGNTWLGDRYFNGGSATAQESRFIGRTIDPTLYGTARTGEFSYDIPLRQGVYELRLHWAETSFGADLYAGGGESSRIFSVSANGEPLVAELDVHAAAGGDHLAYCRVFKDVAPAPDGFLHLRFHPIKDTPFLNAVEIVPGVAGRMRPIRIVAQGNSYTDRNGEVWRPDQYFRGGRLVARNTPVAGTDEPGLFAGERFGNFSYTVPVASGKYTARLYFAETYFGAGNSGFGGPGSRLFDLSCNGVALLRNLDIFHEVGPSRALVKTMRGLQPNAFGQLVFVFTPSRNYAAINALEILDQAND